VIDLSPTYPEPQYGSPEAIEEALRASLKQALKSAQKYHQDLIQYQADMNQWREDCVAELLRQFITD